MTCYYPMTGYRAKARTVNGKRGITFDKNAGYVDQKVDIPCGKCIGCRLEYARQWAIRCMHEASLHEQNCFVTFTYNDANLPYGNSLHKRDLQLFYKKLRHHAKIRHFSCGEYGEETLRPHYHACIFNYIPEDLRPIKRNGEQTLFTSKSLEEMWSHGNISVGHVTFESAGYCARYITKKVLGEKAKESYWRVDTSTGVIHQVAPEFAIMSRGDNTEDPVFGYGLGHGWIDRYGLEVERHDSIIVNGREVLPPKYYDEQLSEVKKQYIKAKRRREAMKDAENKTTERLRIREEVKTSSLTHKRNKV